MGNPFVAPGTLGLKAIYNKQTKEQQQAASKSLRLESSNSPSEETRGTTQSS